MRIRTIKPSFFRDSKLLDVPPLARILFVGLWCCCDRAGRMEFNAREVRLDVLPEESQATFDAHILKLAVVGLIVAYSENGRCFLSVPNFLKHQLPHHREPLSVIPPPPENSEKVSEQREPSTSPGPDQDKPLFSPLGREGKGREGNKNSLREKTAPLSLDGFALFWETYPARNGIKRGKASAMKQWKALGCEPNTDRILGRLERQVEHKAECDASQVFCAEFPDPERWLKHKRWNDVIVESE